MTTELYIIHRTQDYIGLIRKFDEPTLEQKYYYSVSPVPKNRTYEPKVLISGTTMTQEDAMALIDLFVGKRGDWKANALQNETPTTLFCPDHERKD